MYSARHLILVNIFMKSHEDIFNILSNRMCKIKSQNLIASVSKGHNSTNRQSSVTVLAFYTLCNVGILYGNS